MHACMHARMPVRMFVETNMGLHNSLLRDANKSTGICVSDTECAAVCVCMGFFFGPLNFFFCDAGSVLASALFAVWRERK